MDVVLELLDKYAFDHIYAALLPVKPAPYAVGNGVANATVLDPKMASPWEWHPASTFISFTPGEAAYQSQWARDNIWRQLITIFLITWLSGAAIYFIVSTLSYVFIFDKTTFKHPKFLKNQVKMEIRQAVDAMPFIALFTTPVFFAEVRGYSKLYDSTSEGPGSWYNWAQFPLFLVFTDCLIYFIHRGLHHRSVYKYIHKPHHKWIMPTPYASVAFHPVDGFAQSVPYHLFPYIFPLQKFAYLALFIFVQIWTVMIHDGEYVAHNPFLNGAAHHSSHHLFYRVNYGQYFTLWDRLCGTHRMPDEELFQKETKMAQELWERQARETEKIQHAVEGQDERVYAVDAPDSKKEI